jgi:N-acetylneuraminic acid mutarotase
MGGLEHISTANAIFFSITKDKAHYNAILTHYLKIECKKTKINDLLIIYREKNMHIF